MHELRIAGRSDAELAVDRSEPELPSITAKLRRSRQQADGLTRRELPMPFRPGTLGASIDGFAIRYLRTADGVEFLRVQLAAER